MDKPITVVIADQSVQLCRQLRTALEETDAFEVVAITNEGGKAMELVDRFSPDMFIIDLMIPVKNGGSYLGEIIPQKPRLCVIAISFFTTEYTEYTLIERGVCHLLFKPFDMHSAGPYIEQVWKEYSRKNRYITYYSAQQLRALGIPTYILGFPYLQKAIELTAKDPTAAANITRDIYIPIASIFNTTANQVRYEISRAVQLALKCDDPKLLQSIFKNLLSNQTDELSNENFIAALAKYVFVAD